VGSLLLSFSSSLFLSFSPSLLLSFSPSLLLSPLRIRGNEPSAGNPEKGAKTGNL